MTSHSRKEKSYLECDSRRDRGQHRNVQFDGEARGELHLNKVAKLLEVLELRRYYLRTERKGVFE